MDWFALITSLLGAGVVGGIFVAVIEWVREVNKDRSARHGEFLKDQLRYLYGPLHYYLKQNDLIFEFIHKVGDIGKEVFSKPQNFGRSDEMNRV